MKIIFKKVIGWAPKFLILLVLFPFGLVANEVGSKRSHFGLDVDFDFSVKKYDIISPNLLRRDNTGETLGIAGQIYYKWYPFNQNRKIANNIFLKPSLGVGTDRIFGYDWEFLFNFRVLLGYTFDMNSKVSLDLYTGPIAKVRPYSSIYTYRIILPTDHYQAKETYGGMNWVIGVGINLQKIAFRLGYVQPITNMLHYDVSTGTKNPPMLNIGLSVPF